MNIVPGSAALAGGPTSCSCVFTFPIMLTLLRWDDHQGTDQFGCGGADLFHIRDLGLTLLPTVSDYLALTSEIVPAPRLRRRQGTCLLRSFKERELRCFLPNTL